ncbi:DUF4154 domain-containing protein [Labilibacter sediminis]|nr:DUF4154 domain-containing protein [Labilibacter sediminis]
MNKKVFLISNLIICLVYSFSSSAQVHRSELIGAYLYNFAKYTTWPNEHQLNSYHIALISENPEIIHEVKKMAASKKIRNLPIKLSILSSPSLSLQAQLIFLTREKSNYFLETFDAIEGSPTLLVSENFHDKRVVMINLYDTPDKKLLFEVNKANIINQNLSIDPEILLIGGTEIDVADLYRQSQLSLRSLQKRMDIMNDSLQLIQAKAATTSATIKKQQVKITEQEMFLEQYKEEVQRQQEELNLQLTEIGDHEILLEQQYDSILSQGNIIIQQKAEVEHRNQILKKLEQDIDDKNQDLEKKNKVLGDQTITIERQKDILFLSIAVIFLIAALAITLYREYRNNKRINIKLREQKDEIEDINEELVTTNESLSDTLSKLKSTQSQLVHSEKMASLGVLTAGIAHEINNPINFVYTGINSIRKDFEDLTLILNEIRNLPTEKDDLEQVIQKIQNLKTEYDFNEIIEIIPETISDIQTGAIRTAEIVKGLRDFSRIEKDEKHMANIHEGLESALLLLRNKYKHHITIERNFGQLPEIECLPGKLNQAFLNILSNAIDAIEEEGKIEITTYSDDDQLYVSIKDNGKGIPQNIHKKLFDPFFTTKEVGKGVGLGLAITFSIIKEHNGTIEVKSEEKRGSEFIISLPLRLDS